MSNREQNAQDSDALQSAEGEPALGQDERAFGAGGQTVQQEIDARDAPDRETGRDTTVPDAAVGRH
jgi:hypothetical protein